MKTASIPPASARVREYWDYHPEPPIDAGTPEKTDDLVFDLMHQMYNYLMAPLIRAQPDK